MHFNGCEPNVANCTRQSLLSFIWEDPVLISLSSDQISSWSPDACTQTHDVPQSVVATLKVVPPDAFWFIIHLSSCHLMQVAWTADSITCLLVLLLYEREDGGSMFFQYTILYWTGLYCIKSQKTALISFNLLLVFPVLELWQHVLKMH
jgi:hypothetical protein